MGSKGKAPKSPDPKETSAASTATNVGTAVSNAYLGNVNQVTPDGTLTYSQSGNHDWYDPYTGKTYNIPTFTATQTYSPQQQAIKAQSDATELNLGKLANEQSAKLQTYLNNPVDLSNEATESRLMELGRKRLDPLISQRDEELRTRLANQGIKAGSAAYAQEQNTQNQATNDAYNQLLLTGRQQAVNEALTQRNQPINEITALLGGSQVSQPSYVNSNMPSIATTDTAGLINENYNQRLNAYNQQQQQSQGILGGLFGLGSKLIGLSDKRAKKDIKPIGKLYEYRYKGEDKNAPKRVGVMAQEVAKSHPEAVMEGADGLKRVDYGKLFQIGADKMRMAA